MLLAGILNTVTFPFIFRNYFPFTSLFHNLVNHHSNNNHNVKRNQESDVYKSVFLKNTNGVAVPATEPIAPREPTVRDAVESIKKNHQLPEIRAEKHAFPCFCTFLPYGVTLRLPTLGERDVVPRMRPSTPCKMLLGCHGAAPLIHRPATRTDVPFAFSQTLSSKNSFFADKSQFLTFATYCILKSSRDKPKWGRTVAMVPRIFAR